ncbi:hypothetical protein [Lentilactobacillus hilgardii]|uniref:hypothetical protein n=1 Tax=Lentilactobacillus hilgardii TaxID=1588 RepID=UPI003FA60A5A
MPGPQFVFTQIIPDYLVLRQTLDKLGYTKEKINLLQGYKLGLVVYDQSEDSYGDQPVTIEIALVK